MPRIPSEYLNGVFYLYNTREDALKGRKCGGTGFLVGLPSEALPQYTAFVYAVTNWHVAKKQGASVIRMNKKDGTPDILEYGRKDWFFLPKYDIAVLEINQINRRVHETTVLERAAFGTRDWITRADIGTGDDVFMVGRFIDHDGGPTNRPAARFGKISIMPSPIRQENKEVTDSYCLDMNSRTGYSGSPVFVYRVVGGDLRVTNKTLSGFKPVDNFIMFLGVHWGQFPEEVELKGATPGPQYVKGMSGMTCVLPAWTLDEVLNMPELREARRKDDEVTTERFRREGFPPLPKG